MKALWLVPVVAGVALIVHRCKPRLGGLCAHMFESMPDHFPPKQIHQNVLAIREQTERILAILERQARAGG